MSGAVATLDHCAAAASRFLRDAPRRRRDDVTIYLAHVEGSLSLRAVSSASGRALTSVHRAVRRIETLRDDPLFDRSLDTVGRWTRARFSSGSAFQSDIVGDAIVFSDHESRPALRTRRTVPPPSEQAQARQCLRLLEADGAFLLVATGAGRAGIFCRSNDFRRPIRVIEVDFAADLAARDWIRCVSRTTVSAKYVTTPCARRLLREGETGRHPASSCARPAVSATSPLEWLARRHGRGAQPLLSATALNAAYRLRDDFEIGRAGLDGGPDWQSFLASLPSWTEASSDEPAAARRRMADALSALGSGLAEVTTAVCCFDEGLEAVERRMGWAARSAKVVLNIALSRLAAYYGIAED